MYRIAMTKGLSQKDIQRLEAWSGKKVVIEMTQEEKERDYIGSLYTKSGAGHKNATCWCHKGVRRPRHVVRQLLEGTQCSYREVCITCGTIWSDVDDVSIPEYGDCSNGVSWNGELIQEVLDRNL